ncbi:MAG: 50S ribosomal protein L20 [Omnitrophica bacterium RIFCSPHIGHO2_02_FULL_63_14]|nr:MAG: 50S ribosomal protein L20 [Omnitrophica bacterium RIFCSPHIGHO2_02_FULL_63_14]
MAKVKWAVASRRRRKRLLKQAKGYRGARRLHLLKAKETVMRAKAYSTRDRKVKKREFRNWWVIRINAAARARGLTYGRFMAACKKANVALNRKQLAELAVTDQGAFDQLVSQVTTN